jgi:hypothetical protein
MLSVELKDYLLSAINPFQCSKCSYDLLNYLDRDFKNTFRSTSRILKHR